VLVTAPSAVRSFRSGAVPFDSPVTPNRSYPHR
jgi:hypothetical protein